MKILHVWLGLCAAGLLVGCGQKGPLVLPDAPKHKRVLLGPRPASTPTATPPPAGTPPPAKPDATPPSSGPPGSGAPAGAQPEAGGPSDASVKP